MKNRNQMRAAPFADLPLWLKSAVLTLLLIIAVGIIWLAMIRTIRNEQQTKYKQLESNAVISAEQIVNMSVETAVSIAKNIYTNEAIYDFLNTKFASPSDYYATYYPLQQNTALNLADTNLVKSCTIYTENPTVLAGGNLQKLETASESFRKMNKPTILCINPDTMSLVLVRKLDYRSLVTGESYVCLEMNPAILSQFAQDLGFDGEMYVLSGSNLLYSSREEITDIEKVSITPDFECLTHNYYTVDIEFYSRANRNRLSDFVRANRLLLITLIIVLVLTIATGHVMNFGIRLRLVPVLRQYQKDGTFRTEHAFQNGRDEIGQLLGICYSLSEQIDRSGDESRQNSSSLLRKSREYNQLFTTAMRLDAELSAAEKLPGLRHTGVALEVPLAEEIRLLEKAADKCNAAFSCEELPPETWIVPAYSVVLVAYDIFKHYLEPSVTITCTEETVCIAFESPKTPRSHDILKFRAIFEDSNISEAYDFSRNNRFNPYLRLKAELGDRADVEIFDKNQFRMLFTIKNVPVKTEPETQNSDETV